MIIEIESIDIYINAELIFAFEQNIFFSTAVKMQKLLSFVRLGVGYANGIEMVTAFENILYKENFFFQIPFFTLEKVVTF
jgi:hypothetical protein